MTNISAAAKVFDELNPEESNIRSFPVGDSGESKGDAMLSECILYGYKGEINDYGQSQDLNEKQIEWAIKLGRELEKRGIDSNTGEFR